MHQLSRLSFICFSFILLFALSCRKKEATPQDCGCKASITGTAENREASYMGGGQFVLMPLGSSTGYTFGWACDIDSTWQKSAEIISADYVISGNWRKKCAPTDGTYYGMAVGDLIEITSLHKK